jgi:hypothetical protein
MKNLIFHIFKNYFIEQIMKYCKQNVSMLDKYYLIKIKKGKIRETRLYDENHNRIHNFTTDILGNVFINH